MVRRTQCRAYPRSLRDQPERRACIVYQLARRGSPGVRSSKEQHVYQGGPQGRKTGRVSRPHTVRSQSTPSGLHSCGTLPQCAVRATCRSMEAVLEQLAGPATVSSAATPPLEQSSRIAVQVVPLQGELNPNRAFLETTPRALGDLEFNFDSRVTSAEPGLLIENHCSYALRGNNTHARPRLRSRSRIPPLARACSEKHDPLKYEAGPGPTSLSFALVERRRASRWAQRACSCRQRHRPALFSWLHCRLPSSSTGEVGNRS